MKYQEWLTSVPETITGDTLWKMELYRTALFLGDLAWHDSRKLTKQPQTRSLADQLFRAVGSISANIAEGYSRSSGKDQARFYEYSLGSARESRDWYFKARHVLGTDVTDHRLDLLTQTIRQLLRTIPNSRTKSIREEPVEYGSDRDYDE